MQQAEPQELARKSDRRGQHNAGRTWGMPFPTGASGNPSGKSKAFREAKIAKLITEWCEPIGGPENLVGAEKTLIRRAAELVAGPQPRRAEDVVRHANVISRILAQCGLVGGKRPIEPVPAASYTEVAARIAAEQGARRAQELEADQVKAEAEAAASEAVLATSEAAE
jgi:hypothetical protein